MDREGPYSRGVQTAVTPGWDSGWNLTRAEIIWVSRNRTISLLRFFEAFRRWLVDYLTCVHETVLICKVFKDVTNTQNKAISTVVFLARVEIICDYMPHYMLPGWNSARAEISAVWNFSSNRAEISARDWNFGRVIACSVLIGCFMF
jgi:hypothetical protein